MKLHSFALIICTGLLGTGAALGCTTAVISGRATTDGRPLLWKNRDTWQQQNEVIFDDRGTYSFVGVVNAEASQRVWMGANQAGFCIENSLSPDLDDPRGQGPGNGRLIRAALESCASVADFERLLIATNHSGRRTRGNFGVIDAHGGAMLFEVGSRSFQRFDANDPATAPDGFIVRANASISGTAAGIADNNNDQVLRSVYSSMRYCRATELLRQQAATRRDVRFMLQNVARDIAGLEPLDLKAIQPVNTSRTLNRNTTVSAVVFHGVRPGEPAECTTMWTILGEPMFSVAVPIWVQQGRIAKELNGDGHSPLCDFSSELRRRNYQHRTERRSEKLLPNQLPPIQDLLLKIENETIDRTLASLHAWRHNPPDSSHWWRLHRTVAARSLDGLIQLCQVTRQAVDPEAEEPKIHIDFRFNDPDGTRLGETADSAGTASWDGGLTDCRVHGGRLRIRRNSADPVNRYVDLSPDVRVKSMDGSAKSHRGWIVVEIAGWRLRGTTTDELLRIGFTSRPDGHLHVAGLQLRRTGPDEVSIEGAAFGTGGQPIQSQQRWPTLQRTPLVLVIELDKITGNSGEGDSGGGYRLFYKESDAKRYTQIGQPAKVRRLRNGNHMHLHVEGSFGGADEFVDIDRIYFTTVNPMSEDADG